MTGTTLGIAALIMRVLLAAILARASLHKWREHAQFIEELRAYRLLPDAVTAPIAVALAIVESATAITLLNPMWTSPAFAAAALFAIYGGAIAINLLRGRTDISCGCGGPLAARKAIDWTLILRNAGLATLAMFALATSAPSLDLSFALLVVASSATALLLYEAVEQAIANRQQVLAWKR